MILFSFEMKPVQRANGRLFWWHGGKRAARRFLNARGSGLRVCHFYTSCCNRSIHPRVCAISFLAWPVRFWMRPIKFVLLALGELQVVIRELREFLLHAFLRLFQFPLAVTVLM